MKIKYLISLCLIMLFLISIAGVSACENGNQTESSQSDELLSAGVSEDTISMPEQDVSGTIWYVNASAPSGGNGSQSAPYKDFKSVLDNSNLNNGDTVYFAGGQKYTGDRNIHLDITKQLNLLKDGDGEAVFDAKGKSRIFTVTASTININGLTFINGKSDIGGAIYFITSGKIERSNINATYINNTATLNGGANYFESYMLGDCHISGTYINNTAEHGGANYFTGDVQSDIDGTYINNTAEYGGANYFCKLVSLVAGTYNNNTAKQNGGANYIANGFTSYKHSIINGTYNNNTAEHNGGANYLGSDDGIYIISGTYNNNTAKENGGANYFRFSVSNSNITGTYNHNIAAEDGGANYFNDTVSNSNINGTYTNNTANSNGGANRFTSITNSNITGTYTNNTANSNGGANYIENTVSNSNITGTYTQNNATRNGGANYFNNIINSNIDGIFSNNNANIWHGGANYFGGSVSGRISGIYNNNKAKNGDGGANYFYIDVSNSNINGTYNHNTATNGNGGANYFRSGVSNSNITGTYTNNIAAEDGGANRFTSITNSNITGTYINNTATNGDGGANRFTSITNTNITGTYNHNTATNGNGGANRFASVTNSNITGTYINNTAKKAGGANYFYLEVPNSNINGTYINNTADYGGANYFEYDVLDSIITGLYINNTASNSSIIHFKPYDNTVKLKNVTICNSIFLNNKYNESMGVISAEKTGVVAKNNWFGNNATDYKNKPVTKNIRMDSWLFLNATADPSPVSILDSSNVSFELYSTDGVNIYYYENSKLPDVNLTLTATNGYIPNSTSLNKSVEYRATKIGQGSITASVEDVEYTIFLDNNKRDADLSAAVNPQEIDYGENTQISLEYNATATGTVNITLTGKKHSKNFENIPLNKTIQLPNNILPDEYEVTVSYSGDEIFANTSATSTLTVNQLRLDIKVIGYDIYVNETKGLMFIVTLLENTTGNLTISNGITLNVTKEGRKENNSLIIEIMNDAYPVGQYNWTFTYSSDDIYENSSTHSTSNVLIIPTEITANMILLVGDTSRISYNLNPDVAIGPVKFTSNNTNVVEVGPNGNIKAIGTGTALVTVTFEGSKNYTTSSNTITVKVFKKDYNISIDTFDINVTDINALVAVITLPGDASGNVSVTINNDTFVVEINSTTVRGINGALIMPISNNAYQVGDYNIKATYNGDHKYNPSTANGTFTISKSSFTPNITADDTKVRVEVPVDATGNVTLSINNQTLISQIKDGTAVFDLRNIPTGDYNATLTYPGDDTYNGFEETIPISIDNAFILTAENLTKYYGGFERFTVTLTDGKGKSIANASVTIIINGQEYNKTTNKNGKTSMAINLNSGKYSVVARYKNVSADATITVLTTVNGTDLVKVFRNATQYYATFRDSEGNYLKEGTAVRFNINGVFYDRQVSGEKGLARLNLNLEKGEYILTAMNPETGENAANNITILSRITENKDITKYYRNETQYTVKIIGDDGNPVGAGETVTFNINGVFYERQTNESGIAKLNINLQPGDYIITAEYKNCRESNNITVLPVLTAKDLTKKYGTKDPFVATLVDGKGKPYTNQTVTFNINGVFYNRVTDSNGQAKLNINLMAGEYIITSSYNGTNIANTIKVTA